MMVRYIEDYVVGQTFTSGRIRVDKERIRAFASEFDPQPFHLDEAMATTTIFRGLAASGWHTAAITMRLLVDGELRPAGGIVGLGFEEFRCHGLLDQETNSILKARFLKFSSPSPAPSRVVSRCVHGRSTSMARRFRFRSVPYWC